jgi:hypothetical protein
MRLALTLCVAMLAVGLSGCSEPRSPSAESIAETIRKTDQTAASESTAAVYRFAKISSGAYFYTGDRAERDSILASLPDFRYEGVAFLRSSDAAAVPVYRFAGLNNGAISHRESGRTRPRIGRTRTCASGSTFAIAAPGANTTPSPSGQSVQWDTCSATRPNAPMRWGWDSGATRELPSRQPRSHARGSALAGRTWGAGVAVDADAAPVTLPRSRR